VPASSSSAVPSSPSLVVGVVCRQRVVVVLCLHFALRRADHAARLQLQGSLGRHLVAVPPSFPMPCPARRIPRQDLRQRETKRARSITRRRVHNATSLIMSTKRQKGRATVELADLSPIAQRAPSDAIHQSAASLSHLDWGPCGANPKDNQLCFPRQPAPACARSGCSFLEHVRSSTCSRQGHPATSTVANELLPSHFASFLVDVGNHSYPPAHQPPAFAISTRNGNPSSFSEASHRAKPTISCSVKDGRTVFDFRAVSSERKTTFRRPPVGPTHAS
jgi:hypothetical protein